MFKSNHSKYIYSDFTSSTSIDGSINIKGNDITISANRIIVDGKVIKDNLKGNLTIIVEGNCNKLDCTGSVEIKGNCGSIDCGGSCTIKGSVIGNIDAGGSVHCGKVTGDIDAGGSIHCS